MRKLVPGDYDGDEFIMSLFAKEETGSEQLRHNMLAIRYLLCSAFNRFLCVIVHEFSLSNYCHGGGSLSNIRCARGQRCRSRWFCGRGRFLLLPLLHTQDKELTHLVTCWIAFLNYHNFGFQISGSLMGGCVYEKSSIDKIGQKWFEPHPDQIWLH